MQELREKHNLAYSFEAPVQVIPSVYQRIQSRELPFVPCYVVSYNAGTQIIYNTEEYESFDAIINTLDPDGFVRIIKEIFHRIVMAMNDRELRAENIMYSNANVLIHKEDQSVQLVYLPVSLHYDEETYKQFDYVVRSNLLALCNQYPTLASQELYELYQRMNNPALSIEEVEAWINESKQPPIMERVTIQENPVEYFTPNISIVGVHMPNKVEYVVNKPEYVMGKKNESVDGFIDFNNAISRIHCKIMFENGTYYMMDLGSANGTYVNGIRLRPNEKERIKAGDRIRLANSDFIVRAL